MEKTEVHPMPTERSELHSRSRTGVGLFLMAFALLTIILDVLGIEHNDWALKEIAFHVLPFGAGLLLFSRDAFVDLVEAVCRLLVDWRKTVPRGTVAKQ